MIPKISIFDLSQILILVAGAAVIAVVWWSTRTKFASKANGRDWALLFFTISLLLVAAYGVIHAVFPKDKDNPDQDNTLLLTFSLANNILFLLTLRQFTTMFVEFRQRSVWFNEPLRWLLVISGATIIEGFLFFIAQASLGQTSAEAINLIFSLLTILLFGIAVVGSLWRRTLGKPIIVVGTMIVLLMAISQVIGTFSRIYPKSLLHDDIYPVINICSLTCFIFLLLILANSWVVELETEDRDDKIADIETELKQAKNKLQAAESALADLKVNQKIEEFKPEQLFLEFTIDDSETLFSVSIVNSTGALDKISIEMKAPSAGCQRLAIYCMAKQLGKTLKELPKNSPIVQNDPEFVFYKGDIHQFNKQVKTFINEAVGKLRPPLDFKQLFKGNAVLGYELSIPEGSIKIISNGSRGMSNFWSFLEHTFDKDLPITRNECPSAWR